MGSKKNKGGKAAAKNKNVGASGVATGSVASTVAVEEAQRAVTAPAAEVAPGAAESKSEPQSEAGSGAAAPECPAVAEKQPEPEQAGEAQEASVAAKDAKTDADEASKPAKGDAGEAEANKPEAKGDAKADDEEDGIDWLTIVLMILVMANIAYWIWVRDTGIVGDVEMHRPPGVGTQAGGAPQDLGNVPPGPNYGTDAFGRGDVVPDANAGDSSDSAQQQMVRTYIIIANAMEIAGYGDVRAVWDLDRRAMEAARDHRPEQEAKLNKEAYAEALRIMHTCYKGAFESAVQSSNADAEVIADAKRIFGEAEQMNDSKPLEAMARYEDALLRINGNEAFSRDANRHAGDDRVGRNPADDERREPSNNVDNKHRQDDGRDAGRDAGRDGDRPEPGANGIPDRDPNGPPPGDHPDRDPNGPSSGDHPDRDPNGPPPTLDPHGPDPHATPDRDPHGPDPNAKPDRDPNGPDPNAKPDRDPNGPNPNGPNPNAQPDLDPNGPDPNVPNPRMRTTGPKQD